jgi:SAM-dependent methyltransferase
LGAKALGCEVCVVESSTAKISHARDNGLAVISDISELRDGTFDLIYLVQVLEHIPNPRPLLATLVKLLRRGGGCFISVPEASSRFPVAAKGPFHPLEHVNGFTRRSLRKLVLECGLEVQKDYSIYSELAPKEALKSITRNALLFLTPRSSLPIRTSVFTVRK